MISYEVAVKLSTGAVVTGCKLTHVPVGRLSLVEHLTSSPRRPFLRLPKHPHTRVVGFPQSN